MVILGWNIYQNKNNLQRIRKKLLDYQQQTHSFVSQRQAVSSNDQLQIRQVQPTSGPSIARKSATASTTPDEPWGVAHKVDDVTYSIKVGYDASMATPEEVFQALNAYRATKGSQALAWNDRLASYAQQRATYFDTIKGTDKHAGFNTYLNEQDGFNQLRFNRVGENSFYGGPLSGTHVIEWVFSQSPGHNANQLDTGWTHVGIGTSPTAINVNFGSGEF